jgi:glycosyltransferase involved in cell wall biosynthesis
VESIKPNGSSRGPRVSVCLLTYNDVASLAGTVHSILAQTLSDFEFIISDDCSKDGTWEAVLDLAKTHPNIRAIQTPHNMKMCGNANYAVSHASGDYIALLHHGDIYREDLLERWLDVMERYSTVAFVFNDMISTVPSHSKHGRVVYRRPFCGTVQIHKFERRNFSELMAGRRFLEEELLKKWGCCVWGTTMIRRSCWEAVGGIREQFGVLADVDLWMRLAARWDVGYVDAPLFTTHNNEERPEDYAVEYHPHYFWPRKKLTYSIHAANLAEYYSKAGLRRWWKWLRFRTRVSLETCKWLTYALVRKRTEMLLDSVKAECAWEFTPVRWYRNGLIWGKRVGIL